VPAAFTQRSGVVRHSSGTHAQVELLPLAGCEGCERQRKAGFGSGHCGIDFFGLSDKKNRSLISVSLDEHQKSSVVAGDAVEVHIPAPNGQWLALALRVYGFPTVGLMIGAALGSTLNELASIVFSVVGCGAGLLFGRRLIDTSQSIAVLGKPCMPSTRIVSVND